MTTNKLKNKLNEQLPRFFGDYLYDSFNNTNYIFETSDTIVFEVSEANHLSKVDFPMFCTYMRLKFKDLPSVYRVSEFRLENGKYVIQIYKIKEKYENE